MADENERDGDVRFLRRLMLAILVLATAWLFWHLRFVLVLAFGAVLFAMILHSIAGRLRRWIPMPDRLAMSLAILVILGGFAGVLLLFGAQISGQAQTIAERLPDAIEQLRGLIERLGLDGWAERRFQEIVSGSSGFGDIGRFLMTLGDGVTNVIILIFGGIFFAARPQLYRTGLLKLVPERGRANAATALEDCNTALRLWLKGRLMAMVVVGVLTGIGLWLIGVRSYLALALLAAVLEFVPFIGPILAAVPAILLALLESPEQALLVTGLFVLIQQLEGNLITPIIQQHAVELPAALLLFSLLGFALLFGVIGVLLAEPLTVALFVLVKRLYVREALHTDTPMPGEQA